MTFLSTNRPINQPAERLTNQLENNLERKEEFVFLILRPKSYKDLTISILLNVKSKNFSKEEMKIKERLRDFLSLPK